MTPPLLRRVCVCLLAALGAAPLGACQSWRKLVVKMSTPEAFTPRGDPADFEPVFDGPDAGRARIAVALRRVAGGFEMPTDVQFVPGDDTLLVVLEKTGRARWVNLRTRAHGELLQVDVLSDSEQGLLGLAFDPAFAENGRFFIDYTTRSRGAEVSRVEAWHTQSADGRLAPAKRGQTILEVRQPYANHNGGQLQFDAAGYLLVSFGDGGWRGDPKENGQDPSTLLGAILRLDVAHPPPGRAYGIPPDNPFADGARGAPEVYAYGLRNPWRFSVDRRGRLVAGDVGQETWEEVSVVTAGGNSGWNRLEGRHCYEPPTGCDPAGTILPVFEYGHGDAGRSVTGGYEYLAGRVAALQGKYVFGDFVSGRLWALALPDEIGADTRLTPAALGRWPILPSTFGRNGAGDVFVADFSSGNIYVIAPP